jgi:hypothetical protein
VGMASPLGSCAPTVPSSRITMSNDRPRHVCHLAACHPVNVEAASSSPVARSSSGPAKAKRSFRTPGSSPERGVAPVCGAIVSSRRRCRRRWISSRGC